MVGRRTGGAAQGEAGWPAGSSRSTKLQRCVLLAGCIVYALLAFGSGIDRAAEKIPALGRFVPPTFAAQSLLAKGNKLLAARRFGDAEAVARRAVAAAPVDAESSSVLAAARLGQGDDAGAQKAFLVAAQFGWRIPITQLYWMQQALLVGDYRVAALRLDALLREEPALAGDTDLLAPLETTPAGRSALAERLVQKPGWLANYAGYSFALPLDRALFRADVLNQVARRGKPLDCAAIGNLTSRLIDLNSLSAARATWQEHCRLPDTGLITDASFAALAARKPSSVFEWLLIGDSDVSISLDTAAEDGSRHLSLASTASFPRKVLTQLVVLQPGTYRLAWRARTDSGAPSNRIAATLACNADAHEWLPASFDPRANRWVATVSVDGACAASWLGFAILPGQGMLSLDRIELQPVPRG